MQLSDRERNILEALVELFIRDAGPVSSGQLQTHLGLGVSSATIRNDLHGLEDKGLLFQPHTSAGRIPTPEAYRLYVDSLCRPARLPKAWLQRIRQQLPRDPHNEDIEEILTRISRLLAGMTNNVGVGFAVDDHQAALIERIEIVQLAGNRLLVAVTLDDGVVRTSIIPIEHNCSLQALETAVQLLNEIVVDCTLAQAGQRLDSALQYRFDEPAQIARAVARERERIFEEHSTPAMHLEGATEILAEPEFKDPENLRLLVRILDHPETLQPVLRQQTGHDSPSIRIGVESADEKLPFSLVSGRCEIGGWSGCIGILGPLRMHYALALSLVGSVVDSLRSADGH